MSTNARGGFTVPKRYPNLEEKILEVLKKRGPGGATMKEIAKELGVSVFPVKYALDVLYLKGLVIPVKSQHVRRGRGKTPIYWIYRG